MKSLFRFSLFLLLVDLIYLVLFDNHSYGFIPQSLENSIEEYVYMSIPFYILLNCVATVKKAESNSLSFLKVFGALLLAGTSLIVLSLVVLSNMCAYSTIKTLYVFRTNSDRKIVVRDFGCGATDSSPATEHTFDAVTYFGVIVKYNKVDTVNINKELWSRIREPN